MNYDFPPPRSPFRILCSYDASPPSPLLAFSLLVAGPRGPGKLTRSRREASKLVSEPLAPAALQPKPSLLAREDFGLDPSPPPPPGGEAEDSQMGSLTMGASVMGTEKEPVGGRKRQLHAVICNVLKYLSVHRTPSLHTGGPSPP